MKELIKGKVKYKVLTLVISNIWIIVIFLGCLLIFGVVYGFISYPGMIAMQTNEDEIYMNKEYQENLEEIQTDVDKHYSVMMPISYIFATDTVERDNDFSKIPRIYIDYKDMKPFIDGDHYISYDQIDSVFKELNYNEDEIAMWSSSYKLYTSLYSEGVGGSGGLGYPINEPYQITAGFNSNDSVHDGSHTGIDFVSISEDWTVHSANDGKVISTYNSCDPFGGSLGDMCGGGYGNNIVIQHQDGDFKYYTLYGHLAQVNVQVGDQIKRGDNIAIAGNSGNTTGRHLHFELRTPENNSSSAIDPTPYFNTLIVEDEDKKKQMNQAGIDEEDYGYVDYIIDHESSWDYQATNPSSGAYGYCQALPPEKMNSIATDWKTNPQTQLKWCDQYARERYGTWEDAYNFWYTNHWW